MKRYLLGFVGVLGLAASLGTASAADLSRPAPYVTKAPPYAAPYYNWTGFYIGVNGGGAFGTDNFNTSGGLVGGQLGYNWQFGQFVYGLEGDADWSNIRGNVNGVGCGVVGCSINNDFLSTVRGRLGYAVDRVMPYVTGGLAIGNIRTSGPALIGNDQTNAGWTVGGGLEFALPSNWTAKVEYLYVDLGNNCGVGCGLSGDYTTNVVRGGFNYRF
jgi:outer membrane immunogenic protein